MSGKRIGPGLRRAIVVVALTCLMYDRAFVWAQKNFMAAYDSWNQSEMDFWLAVYEADINGAEAAGC